LITAWHYLKAVKKRLKERQEREHEALERSPA
jgi:hypothetical protein